MVVGLPGITMYILFPQLPDHPDYKGIPPVGVLGSRVLRRLAGSGS